MRSFFAALVVALLAFAAGCGGQSGENSAHAGCMCSDSGGDDYFLFPDAIPPACGPLTEDEVACVEAREARARHADVR